jgi:hypothetical protein
MKNNYAAKILLATTLAVAGSFYHTNDSREHNPENNLTKSLERIIERDHIFEQRGIENNSEGVRAPRYRIEANHCSQYAALSARKLFDKKYNRHEAWNLRYKNKIVHEIKENETIKDLIIDGKLKPGMILGIEYPESSHVNDKDLMGDTVKYTHVAVYMGINNKEPEFIHQFGENIEKITEEDFEKKNLIPKEILDVNP